MLVISLLVLCKFYITLLIQFLKFDILGYFKRWELSVANRQGYSDAEKKRMMLSQETLHGITMTGKYMYVRIIVCVVVCEHTVMDYILVQSA